MEDLARRNDGVEMSDSVTLSDWNLSDSSMAILDGRGPLSGKYAIDVRMGGDKQLVGTLRTQRLWDAIYSCLQKIGTPTDANAKNPNFCKSGDKGCAKDCTIPRIVNDANDKGKPDTPSYTNDAKLTVKTYWSEYHEDVHPGVKDLTYRLVADVYRLMTLDDKNCYFVDFPHGRSTKICQILSDVLVAFPTNGGRSEAILNVEVKYSKKIHGTDFSCENVRPIVDSDFKQNYQSNVAKTMGWPGDALVLYVSCPKPNCFETKQYRQEQPFKDDPKCNSLAQSPL